MSDLPEELETYGTTCWVLHCEWESPPRFTWDEAVRDYDEHAAWHRATDRPNGSKGDV